MFPATIAPMGRFLALGGRARPALLTLLVGVLATGALVLAAGPADAHAVLG